MITNVYNTYWSNTDLWRRLLSLASHHRDPTGVGQSAGLWFLLGENRGSFRHV